MTLREDIAADMTIARQRQNLEQLHVGQLVRRFRAGLVEWDSDRWVLRRGMLGVSSRRMC